MVTSRTKATTTEEPATTPPATENGNGASTKPAEQKMTLPTGPEQIERDLAKYCLMIYGDHGLGKSTFCATVEKAFFILTEPGHKGLVTARREASTWADLVQLVKLLKAGKHDFKNVIVDTVDGMYSLCRQYMLNQLDVIDEADLDWGKGWRLVTEEFMRVMRQLALMPTGLWLVAHADEKTMKTRTGKEYQKQVPALPKGVRREVMDYCDFVFFVDIREEKQEDGTVMLRRYLRTKPTTSYEAKDRLGIFPETMQLHIVDVIGAFSEGIEAIDKDQRIQYRTLKNDVQLIGERALDVASSAPLPAAQIGTLAAPAAEDEEVEESTPAASEPAAAPDAGDVDELRELIRSGLSERFDNIAVWGEVAAHQDPRLAAHSFIIEQLVDELNKRGTKQEATCRTMITERWKDLKFPAPELVPGEKFFAATDRWMKAVDDHVAKLKAKAKKTAEDKMPD
jgi:hypothetical protein